MNWILDADIRSFFDTVSHDWLLGFLERRIGDRRVLRLIRQMAEGGCVGGRGRHPGGDWAPRRGRSSRRCWPTSISTMYSTSGSRSGASATPAAR